MIMDEIKKKIEKYVEQLLYVHDMSIYRNINNRNTKLIAPTLVLKFKKEPENKGKFQFNLVFHLEEKEIKDSIEYEF